MIGKTHKALLGSFQAPSLLGAVVAAYSQTGGPNRGRGVGPGGPANFAPPLPAPPRG
jgi:hypothetical protein